jgi:hypothetical protein
LAQRLGCAFIETSAKERINVDEAFIGLVGEIKKFQVSMFPNGSAMSLQMESLVIPRLKLQSMADFS